MKDRSSDFIVIGGGMAGAAVGASLATHGQVQLLEMEDRAGYHSTGRSAAVFAASYGNSVVRALTRASRGFLYGPPADFVTPALVKPRSVLIPIGAGQEAALTAFMDDLGEHSAEFQRITCERALSLCPILRPEAIVGALLTELAADIDVNELHQGYLRSIKANRGAVATDRKVIDLQREAAGVWVVETQEGRFRAPVVVNAAGAWAGEVATLAGAAAVGLEPRRRTAVLVEAPREFQVERWPLVLDLEEQFYIKPEAGLLMLSPADESPSVACDAQPEELDIAVVVDRVERATTLQIRKIAHKWAGLRSFVADRCPVIGYDPTLTGFFWVAALGGYGIQTAPAVGRLACDLILQRELTQSLAEAGVNVAACSPGRFAAKKLL